jgi:hypothetical protein
MKQNIAAVWVLAALVPALSEAQVTLTPPTAPKWDAAVSVGWLAANKPNIGAEWNRWSDTATFDAGAGRYLNPHVKIEFDVAAAVKARVLGFEPAVIPESPYTYPRAREHTFQTVGVSGGLAYQFFENAWFHPFVGGGIAVVHETQRAERLPVEPRFVDVLRPPVLLPELPAIDMSTTEARPFLTTGFKVYVMERFFFRSDVRVAASAKGAETVAWRGGMGVDF